jgi:ribose transport system substrate-binding protein
MILDGLLKGKRIFYVEDNVSNRALAQLVLEQNGAAVHYERWGDLPQVLARLADFMPVDLILMDLMFPKGASGYDLFDGIRANDQYKDIPIVAISASDPSIEMPKARAKGFSGYIAKPINMMEFPRQIITLIEGSPVWYAE